MAGDCGADDGGGVLARCEISADRYAFDAKKEWIIDQDLLKSAHSQNEAVKAICDHMAAREHNQTETKLSRIVRRLTNDGLDLRKSEVIGGFRKLEEAGCGRYIEGRHGWPSRVVWEVRSLTVADAARGTKPLEPSAPEDFDVEATEDAELIEHTFALRPELSISIELPTDLTKTEAARLAAFVPALPFDAEVS